MKSLYYGSQHDHKKPLREQSQICINTFEVISVQTLN